ncbi:MAG: dephospho-CoA kinase [Clostridiales Family XIII bacterium]|nr:dephospho-CoA kinase [Clostridiales Family XIII bacterium]
MKRIGITGGIGAGKSAVTEYLRSKGYTVVDADELAREATAPGQPALERIREAFGDGVFVREPVDDGAAAGPLVLDRKALAAVVFADDGARARLEAIGHADVFARMAEAAPGADGVVFYSIPLLFEAGPAQGHGFDAVWHIAADDETRLARACARDGTNPRDIRARMAAQLPEAEKRARADVVIDNNGTLAELHAQVDALLRPLPHGADAAFAAV